MSAGLPVPRPWLFIVSIQTVMYSEFLYVIAQAKRGYLVVAGLRGG